MIVMCSEKEHGATLVIYRFFKITCWKRHQKCVWLCFISVPVC